MDVIVSDLSPDLLSLPGRLGSPVLPLFLEPGTYIHLGCVTLFRALHTSYKIGSIVRVPITYVGDFALV